MHVGVVAKTCWGISYILECPSREAISAIDFFFSTDIFTTQVRTIDKNIYVSHEYHLVSW